MKKGNELSDNFITKDGVRQAGALSSASFIMIIEDVIKKVKAKVKQIQVGYRYIKIVDFSELAFDNDLVLFARNKNELKNNLVVGKKSSIN